MCRRRRIADRADDLALGHGDARGDSRRDRVEVAEEHHVVTEATAFTDGVAREHRRTEERTGVEDLGGALLVLEGDHRDGRALLLREIHRAVADVREATPRGAAFRRVCRDRTRTPRSARRPGQAGSDSGRRRSRRGARA